MDTTTEWVRLGMVTTDNGMLAIVPPYYGDTLGQWWHSEYLPKLEKQTSGLAPRINPQFEEVTLRQNTTSVMQPEGFEDSQTCLVLCTPSNGGYDVEGRFEDIWHDGGQVLVEVRIRLWEDDDDDTEKGQAG